MGSTPVNCNQRVFASNLAEDRDLVIVLRQIMDYTGVCRASDGNRSISCLAILRYGQPHSMNLVS